MSTYMAKPETVVRSWYIIDAAGKPLGKTAAAAANILRGKHRPEFTPHVDCGENVIIINCAKAVLTGKKLDQKFHRTHSGYIGGLKEIDVSVPSVKGDIKVQIRRSEKEICIVLDSPAATVARVGIPKFGGQKLEVSVTGDAVFESEDEKYVYFTAKPGRCEFVGRA